MEPFLQNIKTSIFNSLRPRYLLVLQPTVDEEKKLLILTRLSIPYTVESYFEKINDTLFYSQSSYNLATMTKFVGVILQHENFLLCEINPCYPSLCSSLH